MGEGPNDGRGDVTELLERAGRGNRPAFDALLPLVYGELKALARSRLRLERDGHTLNATALVHEAYLKLVDQSRVEWQGRSHFFAVAAQAMRRILTNYAKARNRQKRGGGALHVELEAADISGVDPALDAKQAESLLALDEALDRLSSFNPEGADVVQYRFFGGLTNDQIAEVMELSEATVRRRWTMARAWLRTKLADDRLERSTTLLAAPLADGDPSGPEGEA